MAVAAVTGGSSGIGKAYVLALLQRGWSVSILDVANAEVIAAELEAQHPNRVAGFHCNVADAVSFRQAFDAAVARFGAFDCFVNNAGIGGLMFADTQRIVDVNLVGVIRGTEFAVKAATNSLKERASKPLLIVNTASTNGLIPADCDMAPVYVATKFGIVGFTHSLKFLHPKYNVRVNCICPVTVDTALAAPSMTPEILAFLDREQRGGVLPPSACAEALLKLVDNDTIAGEVVTVHPSVPGGKVEPLDPTGQFDYLGIWSFDRSSEVNQFVDSTLTEIRAGNINAWSSN